MWNLLNNTKKIKLNKISKPHSFLKRLEIRFISDNFYLQRVTIKKILILRKNQFPSMRI